MGFPILVGAFFFLIDQNMIIEKLVYLHMLILKFIFYAFLKDQLFCTGSNFKLKYE